MTREEAIEKLELLRQRVDEDTYRALIMAIKALEQPCELLILKSDILLHQDDRKKWAESLKQEKEKGLIILPPYFTPLLVPNDVEIRIEQQPCDDAISREAVLKEIDKRFDMAKPFKTLIKSMPPVQPSRPCNKCAMNGSDSKYCDNCKPNSRKGRYKDCKYFELDYWAKINGVPMICAHEICTKWCGGVKTSSDGYCHLFEEMESEE